MSRRTILTLLACLVAMLSLCGCSRKKTKTIEVPIGYQGSARYNEFLALQDWLEDYHAYEVGRRKRLASFPRTGVALVIRERAIETGAEARRFKDWINDGGHLIYMMSRGIPEAWSEEGPVSFRDIGAMMRESEHPLLAEFEIGISAESSEDAGMIEGKVTSSGLQLDLGVSGYDLIDARGVPESPQVVIGESDDAASIISLRSGSGRLTVIASSRPFHNRYIDGDNDHGRIFLELLRLHDAGAVRFIFGGSATFFSMLMQKAWMPILGLAILTLFWIWKNLSRFGPTIPQFDGGSRQFTEHIEMGGRFLWRYKASAELLQPLVGDLMRDFYQRNPHLAESPVAHISYFVENTKLSQDEVAEALSGQPAKDAASMTRIVRNLKTMKESL